MDDDYSGGWVLYPPLREQSAELPWWMDTATSLASLGGWNGLIALTALVVAVVAAFERRVLIMGAAALVSAVFGFAATLWLIGWGMAPATTFFDPAGGGDPVLYQHAMWFFGQPEVYSFIAQYLLLAVGTIWAARACLRRGWTAAMAGVLLAAAGLIAWQVVSLQQAFVLFEQGIAPGKWIELPFAISGWLALGVLAAGLIANWRGVRANPVGLAFLISGMLVLAGGWYLGYRLANTGVDSALHDTYYVRAHFKYVTALVLAFGGFALVYFGFRWAVGVAYNRWLGGVHWLAWTAGVLLVALPQYFLGQQGMPRRYVDYAEAYTAWDGMSAAGYVLILASAVLFALVIIEGFVRRVRSGPEVSRRQPEG